MVIQYAMVYYLQLCNMQCVHVHLVLIVESQQGTQHAPNMSDPRDCTWDIDGSIWS